MNFACYVQRHSSPKNSFPSDSAGILEVSLPSVSHACCNLQAVSFPAWEPNVQRYLHILGPSCPSFLSCGLSLEEEGRVKSWGSPREFPDFALQNIFTVKSSTMQLCSKESLDSKETQKHQSQYRQIFKKRAFGNFFPFLLSNYPLSPYLLIMLCQDCKYQQCLENIATFLQKVRCCNPSCSSSHSFRQDL